MTPSQNNNIRSTCVNSLRIRSDKASGDLQRCWDAPPVERRWRSASLSWMLQLSQCLSCLLPPNTRPESGSLLQQNATRHPQHSPLEVKSKRAEPKKHNLSDNPHHTSHRRRARRGQSGAWMTSNVRNKKTVRIPNIPQEVQHWLEVHRQLLCGRMPLC